MYALLTSIRFPLILTLIWPSRRFCINEILSLFNLTVIVRVQLNPEEFLASLVIRTENVEFFPLNELSPSLSHSLDNKYLQLPWKNID